MEEKNKCELCSKDFSGLSDENINRHQIACRKKEVEKHNKIKVTEKKRKHAISSYFIPEKKSCAQKLTNEITQDNIDDDMDMFIKYILETGECCNMV